MSERGPKVVPEGTPEQVAAARAAAPATAEEARERNLKEYSVYVAAEPISYRGVLIHNQGDPVPASNVGHNVDESQVVKVGSAAHKKLRAEMGLPPLDE